MPNSIECFTEIQWYHNNIGVGGEQGGDGMKEGDENCGCGLGESELVGEYEGGWRVLECAV